MSIEFWAGVLLSGIVGFPVAIIANLYSDQVRDYLGRRRAIKLNKKRALELQMYQRVLRLVKGDPLQTLLLADQRYSILSSYCVSYASIGIFAAILYFRQAILSVVSPFVPLTAMVIVSLGGAIIGFAALSFVLDYQTTMRKVRRFSEYEAQIREKWGDDAI